MFSLVKFDNDEYHIELSKRVSNIQDADCLGKYKGGAKYHATLIQSSDSEKQLIQQQEHLECAAQVVTNELTPKNITTEKRTSESHDRTYEVHKTGCSTPLNEESLSPLKHQITLSDIVGDRRSSTFGNDSAESSAPPSGCTDIINVVGEVWMQNFANTSEDAEPDDDEGGGGERRESDNEDWNNYGEQSKHEDQANNEKQNFEQLYNGGGRGNEGQGNDEGTGGEGGKSDEEGRADNEKQSKHGERDNNERQNHSRELDDGEERGDEEQDNDDERGGKEGRSGEEEDDNEEQNNNEEQSKHKEQNNNEQGNSEELDGGEERSHEGQDDDEGKDGEGGRSDEEEDDNEEQNNNEAQSKHKEQDNNEQQNSKKPDDGEERGHEGQDDDEGKDGEGEGSDEEEDDNEEQNNNEAQSKHKEQDNNEQQNSKKPDDGEERGHEGQDDDEGKGGEGGRSDKEGKYNTDEDYNENNNDDQNSISEERSDDDIVKDSDYVPDESTLNRTVQISQGHVTNNSSRNKSIIDARPVDIRSVYVPQSKNRRSKTAKKYFCPYCKKLQTKFARHLELKHKTEADVGKFIKLPKGNHERAKIIETIRKYGNFLHNTDSDLNTGVLITCRQRQPKHARSAEDYICCSSCKGFFSKQTLRLHTPKCNTTHKKGVRDITVMGRRLTGYIHELANTVLRRTVFPVMRDDEVVRSIKYDELIILFGNRLCDKYTHTHQHDMIRAQLRLLGRFKCVIKGINKDIDDFASIFHPKFYDAAVLAVRECAKYNAVTQMFGTPAVATMLGTLLKKCIARRKAQCIRKQDYEGKKAAEEFLVLFEDDFPTTINKKVLEDQTKQKRQKKIILPSNQDIRRLYEFLRKKCQASLKILEKQFALSAWKVLTECTLILVQIFNRRRAGEIERLLITDYENQTALDESVNADLYAKLSNESKVYAKQFSRLTIRGKLGRTVPVLLYPLHVACINMISKFRTEAGVQSDNEFIFSVPNSNWLKKKVLKSMCIDAQILSGMRCSHANITERNYTS